MVVDMAVLQVSDSGIFSVCSSTPCIYTTNIDSDVSAAAVFFMQVVCTTKNKYSNSNGNE